MPKTRERRRRCLMGLAARDAVGTTVEFRSPNPQGKKERDTICRNTA